MQKVTLAILLSGIIITTDANVSASDWSTVNLSDSSVYTLNDSVNKTELVIWCKNRHRADFVFKVDGDLKVVEGFTLGKTITDIQTNAELDHIPKDIVGSNYVQISTSEEKYLLKVNKQINEFKCKKE